ncbi:thermonuclease family protein [Mesomycoplasma neurolyticum]|uniref:TNase-like domain-containing protein n=1 Tax=Mesomycoplasma neurolyticum TaxID=2120 RepID=A0A449A5W6_9BACT|nr:hypothetical protein [Mesomycoplasma neurolyticum]VEU59619.1 Uncharacterised protein [Mesomycoplasma neurolyticum]
MKKIYIPLIVSLPITTIAFVSCQSYKSIPETKFDIEKIKGISAIKATISKWTDGDTAEIEFSENKNFASPGLKKNIRIEFIDTPEMGIKSDGNYKKTEGIEREWAEKVTEYAKEILPKGKELLYVFSGTKPIGSYNRIVGSFYYKDDSGKWINYSTEIIAAGLSIPTYDTESFGDDSKIGFYEAPKAWKAFNEAWKNQRGFYKGIKYLDYESLLKKLESIYGKHGAAGIEFMRDEFYNKYMYVYNSLKSDKTDE